MDRVISKLVEQEAKTRARVEETKQGRIAKLMRLYHPASRPLPRWQPSVEDPSPGSFLRRSVEHQSLALGALRPGDATPIPIASTDLVVWKYGARQLVEACGQSGDHHRKLQMLAAQTIQFLFTTLRLHYPRHRFDFHSHTCQIYSREHRGVGIVVYTPEALALMAGAVGLCRERASEHRLIRPRADAAKLFRHGVDSAGEVMGIDFDENGDVV